MIASEQKQAQYDKAKAELDDETKMRDPNSDISKMVTDLAQKTGILKPGQSASAMSLKKVERGRLLSDWWTACWIDVAHLLQQTCLLPRS